jgi:hypothetical protein
VVPIVLVEFNCQGGKRNGRTLVVIQIWRKEAHGHVVYSAQEAPFWAPFDAVFDISCPGNERYAVKSGLSFRVGVPDRASRLPLRFCGTCKESFRPQPSLHSTLSFI